MTTTTQDFNAMAPEQALEVIKQYLHERNLFLGVSVLGFRSAISAESLHQLVPASQVRGLPSECEGCDNLACSKHPGHKQSLN